MKYKQTFLVVFTAALAVVVACGGSSKSDVFGGASEGGGDSGADATPSPSGSDASAAADASGDGGSSGGKGKKDAGTDAAIDATPAVDAGSLCMSTGGTESTSLCCKSASDFPDTCKVGACGCSPGNSHTVQSCLCPVNECYDALLGCRPR